MRSMFVSRSSFEKPSPLERCSRTSSPSSHSTRTPRRSSSGRTSSAIVVFPAPDSPVNQSVNPLVIRLLDQRCVDVDAALELFRAGPAPRALVLAHPDGAFSLDIADPPISTLLPYTVLFRMRS